jgi:hypothetical protein
MKWPQWYPTRADIFGGLFVVLLLCVCAVAAIIGPLQRTNAGFGSEWDCKVIPKSEPICVRKPGPLIRDLLPQQISEPTRSGAP